jgi:hypothetical protein
MTSEELIKLISKDVTTSKVFNTLQRLGLTDNTEMLHSFDFENMKITNLGLALLNTTVQTVDLSWIDEYRNLFKAKNNTKIGTKQGVVSKMTAFLKSNPYSREDILKATQLYIDNLQGYGDHQMASADYFIYYTEPNLDPVLNTKVTKSQLLKWIEISKDSNTISKNDFIEKL